MARNMCYLLPAGAMSRATIAVLLFVGSVSAFRSSHSSASSVCRPRRTTATITTTTALNGLVKPYEHHGLKLSYRYRPGLSRNDAENGPPLVLIHPIGIGLSSWFWRQFINYWDGPNELFAPDLLGCGLENGNDEWNPAEEVMMRPDKSTTLAYEDGIKTLIMEKIYTPRNGQKCVLVSQGGLAPVAVELAKRNPDLVSHLILISPPTWKEMVNPFPTSHRVKKYRAYTGPMSYMRYDALEKPFGFKAYMQRYFKKRPDDQFVSMATEEGRVTKAARGTIASYNSGALFDKSYEGELRSIAQPTLILCGDTDQKRTEQRRGYLTEMRDATLAVIKGKSVLPWESPVETRNALKAFIKEYSVQEEVEDPVPEKANGSRSMALNMPPPIKYQHFGWTLTYRHKPAAPGHEFDPTLLLIHGIGVGQSSWIWEKIFERYQGEIIAPDLIGCGLENGGDPWDPSERDLQVPRDWVEAIETLMRMRGFNQMHRCVVVAQNAVAPVGIKLAYRNEGTVSHLVLLSPPCWERLTSEYTSEEERQKRHRDNEGSAADYFFKYLESKVGYRLKMREFFKGTPDERFINLATAKQATTREARNPIIAMNSGDINYRSFETELRRLKQPTLILTGSKDKVRTDKRPGFGLAPYSTKMANEKTVVIDGKIMLPWESPDAVMEEMRIFLGLKDVDAEETARIQRMFTKAQKSADTRQAVNFETSME